MSGTDPLPARIRDYRVDAEARQTPDLHKLAQLFIGMAQARARESQNGTHARLAGRKDQPGRSRGIRDDGDRAR